MKEQKNTNQICITASDAYLQMTVIYGLHFSASEQKYLQLQQTLSEIFKMGVKNRYGIFATSFVKYK